MSTNNTLKAIMFAADAHKNQKRKGNDGSPYINHLIETAYLLTKIAKIEDDEIIQAAILHDIIEDTNVTLEILDAEFGKRVASLVKSITDDKSLSLEERRANQIAHLASACNDAKLIKLADNCSNIISIPPNWSKERIESYRKWSHEVASLCFDVSESLALEYQKRYKTVPESVL